MSVRRGEQIAETEGHSLLNELNLKTEGPFFTSQEDVCFKEQKGVI